VQIAGICSQWLHGIIMIALLQRVTQARVDIEGTRVASISRGLLVLVGVRPEDDEPAAVRLLDRLLKYRVFADAADKMNLSLTDVAGGLLLVPQFTLAADTRKGLRPGFSSAAAPERALALFTYLVAAARKQHPSVECGVFGAHMQVSLVNDGPVTIWLES
jgi:D-tyrosyl-tRNA(Tyr) deacylase